MKHRLIYIVLVYYFLEANVGYAQINCSDLSASGCNLISNNTFTPSSSYNSSTMSHYREPFQLGLVPGWLPTHGTAQVYDGVNLTAAPPFTGAGYARMGVFNDLGDPLGEGIAQKIPPLQDGNTYLFSFFNRRISYNVSDNNNVEGFYIVLMHCDDYDEFNPSLNNPDLFLIPSLPVQSQTIYCRSNISSTNWQQIVTKFVPNDNYNMVWIFPADEAPATFSNILFSYPELIDVTNFNAGPTPVADCNTVLGPTIPNCTLKNGEFKWIDPNGNTVYQGPNQNYNLNMSSSLTGTYIFQMVVPGALFASNGCNTTTILPASPVTVSSPQCDCTGLQILNPKIEYWHKSPTGLDLANYSQDLNTCSQNKLCYAWIDDPPFEFTASSNQTSGNVWEARIVAVSPFTYYGSNPQGTFNNNGIPYPYSAAYYNFNNSQNSSLLMEGFSPANEVFIVEVKLTNTILNQTKTIQIKVVPRSDPGPQSFWCVQTSPAANYPHQLIFGLDGSGNYLDIPGFTYNWALPSGMTLLTPTSHMHVEWDDASFNYTSNPNPTATLSIANGYGCPSYDVIYNINPQYCIPARPSITRTQQVSAAKILIENDKPEDKIFLYPNPAKNELILENSSMIKKVIVTDIYGRRLKHFEPLQKKVWLNISDLSLGIYMVTIQYENSQTKTQRFIKH